MGTTSSTPVVAPQGVPLAYQQQLQQLRAILLSNRSSNSDQTITCSDIFPRVIMDIIISYCQSPSCYVLLLDTMTRHMYAINPLAAITMHSSINGTSPTPTLPASPSASSSWIMQLPEQLPAYRSVTRSGAPISLIMHRGHLYAYHTWPREVNRLDMSTLSSPAPQRVPPPEIPPPFSIVTSPPPPPWPPIASTRWQWLHTPPGYGGSVTRFVTMDNHLYAYEYGYSDVNVFSRFNDDVATATRIGGRNEQWITLPPPKAGEQGRMIGIDSYIDPVTHHRVNGQILYFIDARSSAMRYTIPPITTIDDNATVGTINATPSSTIDKYEWQRMNELQFAESVRHMFIIPSSLASGDIDIPDRLLLIGSESGRMGIWHIRHNKWIDKNHVQWKLPKQASADACTIVYIPSYGILWCMVLNHPLFHHRMVYHVGH